MPEASPKTPWSAVRAAEIIAEGGGIAGALLPLLQALQDEFGHVPDEAVPLLAVELNLSRAEIHGVITFYHDFRRTAVRGRLVRFCRAEACQARGARAAEMILSEALHENDSVTLEAVYCLGLCASGPAALVDGRPVARLHGERLARLIRDLAP
jgi:formate dehydrogenase subunit gamma